MTSIMPDIPDLGVAAGAGEICRNGRCMMFRRVALVALLSPVLMIAQTVSGVVTGSIKDPADAMVVGAKVVLVNEANGFRRETISNEVGTYTFNSVQPGSYSMSIEQSGFKTFQRTNIVLAANDRLPVDVKLEIGATAETVRVEAQGATVQTASAERAATVTAGQLTNLMLKGRDFMGMLKLLPGVVDTNSRESPTNNSLSGVNIQGGRGGTYNLTLDGVTNLDTGSNTGPYFEPSMDSVAEVKVLLSNYQAEYGRNSGASINVVLKSGSRDFHGTGYYYKRNEGLNANNFFNNVAGLPRERYRYDLFGYTIGGPLYIPGKFNRNREKLFFFFSQEISPERSPIAMGFRTVPTALERAGNFSDTRESDGRLVTIKDPTTGQPFPGNIIPQNRINANGQALLNLFPVPNISTPTRQYNYVYTGTVNRPRHYEVMRVDYSINPTTTFFARALENYSRFEGALGFTGASGNWPQFPMLYNLTARALVANLTKVISPTTVNEFTAGITRGVQDRFPFDNAALKANQRSTNGLKTLGQFHPEINPMDIIPNATFGGVPNAVQLITEPKFPFVGRNNIWNFTDNFSHVRGAHTLKLGIYFEPTSRNASRESIFQGAFDFGRNTNNPLDSGWAWSNAVLGNFNSYNESDARTFAWGRFKSLEWYAQDSWRVTRRLVLDFGMRFYLIQPNYSAKDNVAGFVPSRYDPSKAPLLYEPALVGGKRMGVNPLNGATVPAVLIGAFVPGSGNYYNGMVVASQDPSYPRGLIDNRGVQYAPRFGFAYDVFGNGKTALRGGFGIFYDRLQTDQILEMAENPPLRSTPILYYNNLSTYLQSQGSLFPSDVKGLSRSGEVPSVMNWSFGVQQDVGFRTVLDVSYVGSVGRHLMVSRNYNATPYGSNFLPQNQDPTTPGKPLPANFFRNYPGFGAVNMREFSSTSNYHALQVQANRRFAHSLQYGVSWTWSKTMDYCDDNFCTVASYAPLRVFNYGRANFDRTHNLTFSYMWDLPRYKRAGNPLLRFALDQWQFSGITSFISGAPSGIGMSTTDNADIPGGGDGVRTVLLADPILSHGERTMQHFFNTAAFGRPEKGTFGNTAKDIVRGPGINTWDMSLFKNFPLGSEARRLQFRVEAYNAWNHTQFSAMDTSARFSPDGKQVNARFGAVTAARPPRQLQLSLRFLF